MKIQETLGAFLSAHGKHELAAEAFESTDRNTWVKLADEAIRSAPEFNRTHTAQVIKLALDAPENGGPGEAEDFVIRTEENPVLAGIPIYRAYKSGTMEYCGLASNDKEKLARRLVGMYVVRNIEYK